MLADIIAPVASWYAQLIEVPGALLNIESLDELKVLYTTTDPLVSGLTISLAISPLFLLVSEIKRNYSQVDRAWSILPPLFQGHFVLWAWLNGIWIDRIALASIAILVCKFFSEALEGR